jgi:epoxyqueuosine reductase QueG
MLAPSPPEEGALLVGYWLAGCCLCVVGCCWARFDKQSFAKKKQEEIRYPGNEDQTCPGEIDAPNLQKVV